MRAVELQCVELEPYAQKQMVVTHAMQFQTFFKQNVGVFLIFMIQLLPEMKFLSKSCCKHVRVEQNVNTSEVCFYTLYLGFL